MIHGADLHSLDCPQSLYGRQRRALLLLSMCCTITDDLCMDTRYVDQAVYCQSTHVRKMPSGCRLQEQSTQNAEPNGAGSGAIATSTTAGTAAAGSKIKFALIQVNDSKSREHRTGKSQNKYNVYVYGH
ncbi:hypothetical protein OOU_Y34scaffold00768g14 [Pyricularia oryzae Y34]|uniref:Uncharacterized protein n=2 Tax=Pyricularia oryzae TaxID=318829 RepID=A0AA97NQ94_PYRO3|nr:hypothetical protein OOU_Y34scaffold00768g14 [Pyricularia oryzae Y34]